MATHSSPSGPCSRPPLGSSSSCAVGVALEHVLLLDANYSPLGVVGWQRAVCLVLEDKARAVETYAGRVIRSPSFELAWPAVVCLVEYVGVRLRPGPSRLHVLARDEYQCQYCGVRPSRFSGKPDVDALTLDHVIPRARSRQGMVRVPWSTRPVRVTSWENLTTACGPCNRKKAARTPDEAGIAAVFVPSTRTSLGAFRLSSTMTLLQ
jgi:5-methylcytosine-specific restriction endonuclease McrA